MTSCRYLEPSREEGNPPHCTQPSLSKCALYSSSFAFTRSLRCEFLEGCGNRCLSNQPASHHLCIFQARTLSHLPADDPQTPWHGLPCAAMDPILKVIMEDEPVSTTPQQVFQQADELLQQAAALREDANDLRERVKFMYDRADPLTTTAEGLQEIALQDRDAMQERWDYGSRMGQDDLKIYVSNPENAARFNEMQTRIEDGMVNAREMDTFADDVDDFVESRRAQRSATPEPETPAISEGSSSACESVEVTEDRESSLETKNIHKSRREIRSYRGWHWKGNKKN